LAHTLLWIFPMDIQKPSLHQIISKVTRPSSPDLPGLRPVRTRYLAEVERFYLMELMKSTAGDVHNACRISGLSRSRLYALLHKYEVPRHM
jgi:two-component system, NtrC family, response regulator